LKDVAVVMDLHELAPVGGRPASGRDRRRLERFAKVRETRGVQIASDNRLPLPGTILKREYKGRVVRVKVLLDGFEFEGERYKSLTAVAKAITGKHWNGFHFFNLPKDGGEA
jgi:hypothetical protein